MQLRTARTRLGHGIPTFFEGRDTPQQLLLRFSFSFNFQVSPLLSWTTVSHGPRCYYLASLASVVIVLSVKMKVEGKFPQGIFGRLVIFATVVAKCDY